MGNHKRWVSNYTSPRWIFEPFCVQNFHRIQHFCISYMLFLTNKRKVKINKKKGLSGHGWTIIQRHVGFILFLCVEFSQDCFSRVIFLFNHSYNLCRSECCFRAAGCERISIKQYCIRHNFMTMRSGNIVFAFLAKTLFLLPRRLSQGPTPIYSVNSH